jgi:hypothetical protein
MPLPSDEKLIQLGNDLIEQFDTIFGLHPDFARLTPRASCWRASSLLLRKPCLSLGHRMSRARLLR